MRPSLALLCRFSDKESKGWINLEKLLSGIFPGVHIFSLYQTISLWFELKFFHFIIFSLRVENLIEFNFA